MRFIDCHVPEGKENRLWYLVEDPESFWGDLPRQGRHLLKRLLEHGMLACREQWVNAGWHEVTADRRAQCNGFYRRKAWPTSFGPLTDVRVPRCRQAGLTQKIQRIFLASCKPMEDAVCQMFLAGVSTRRVGELLERIIGQGVSAGTVSRITRTLDAEVSRWHRRPLTDHYRYLLFDGIHLKARSTPSVFRAGRKSRPRVVLVAYGVTEEGVKELIDFRIAPKESAPCWEQFLWSLYHRGLTADATKLITTDGGKGILKAIDDVYPLVLHQRCWFHKMQNVANKLSKKDRTACVQDLRSVYQAANRREAVGRYNAWATRWRQRYPKAVACVEADLEALLTFFACPPEHRKMVRTTNAIERCFREVRRRTHSIGCFVDDPSIRRLVYAIFQYFNQKRAGQVCKEFKASKAKAA